MVSVWSVLQLAGAAGAVGFVVVATLAGATRRDYSPLRHAVSSLARGPGGLVQRLDFLLGGGLVAVGGVALVPVAWPLGIGTVMLGGGLLVSGVYRVDPMRGYPPGAPEGDPAQPSRSHRLHDAVGGVVFLLLPLLPVVAALSPGLPTSLRVLSVLAALVAGVCVVVFTRAWRSFSPRAGLAQRVPLATGLLWLAVVLTVLALA